MFRRLQTLSTSSNQLTKLLKPVGLVEKKPALLHSLRTGGDQLKAVAASNTSFLCSCGRPAGNHSHDAVGTVANNSVLNTNSASGVKNSNRLAPSRSVTGMPKDPDYTKIFENNRKWVNEMKRTNPKYFEDMAKGQSPKYLWIGCSDSRVPSATITGLAPGELFVHRNVANCVIGTDFNIMSVLQFSVEVLKVKHIIVCGHYECGGVKASMTARDAGLIENWLRHIRDVHRLHNSELVSIADEEQRFRRLVELNVQEQCLNLFKTGIVQRRRAESLKEGGQRFPQIHGMVYDIKEGLLRELPIDFDAYAQKFDNVYKLY